MTLLLAYAFVVVQAGGQQQTLGQGLTWNFGGTGMTVRHPSLFHPLPLSTTTHRGHKRDVLILQGDTGTMFWHDNSRGTQKRCYVHVDDGRLRRFGVR